MGGDRQHSDAFRRAVQFVHCALGFGRRLASNRDAEGTLVKYCRDSDQQLHHGSLPPILESVERCSLWAMVGNNFDSRAGIPGLAVDGLAATGAAGSIYVQQSAQFLLLSIHGRAWVAFVRRHSRARLFSDAHHAEARHGRG